MTGRRNLLLGFGALAGVPPVEVPSLPIPTPTALVPLGDMSVVGTRHHALARVAATLAPGQPLLLLREPANRYDPLAIAVHAEGGERLGYLPRIDARRIVAMMDAGGKLVAEVADGSPIEVAPGEWRVSARLGLLAEASPPVVGPEAPEQVAAMLRAPPAMVQSTINGARCVMLTGPAAGWQSRRDGTWVPPGALALPGWDWTAHQYRLVGGEAARIATIRAQQEAERLGMALAPDTPGRRAAIRAPQGADPLARKRRGRGIALPARMRLVALRLEAGRRETPQRFLPVAAWVFRLPPPARRRFVDFLLALTAADAVLDTACPAPVLDLLRRAISLERRGSGSDHRRQALTDAIHTVAPPQRRRRSVHCHGQVVPDRRLLVLRGIVTDVERDAWEPAVLRWTIAYAMADYDRDHFVMRGAHLAQRVRALAAWIEAEMAAQAGLVPLPLGV